MYQDWNIQFAIIDKYNSPIEIYEVEYDLTKALSMKSFDLKKSIDKIPQENYKVGIRIIQPMADQPKNESWGLDARNTYILFSNEMELIHGSWTSDNLLLGGWSILGKINVK